MVAKLTTVDTVVSDHVLRRVCLTQDGRETNKGGQVNNEREGEDDCNECLVDQSQ